MSSCVFALNDFAVTSRCIAVHFYRVHCEKDLHRRQRAKRRNFFLLRKPLPYIEQNFYFVQSLVCFYQGAPCRGADRGLRRRCVSALLLICIFDSQFLVKCFLLLYYSTFRATALLPRMRSGLTQVLRSKPFIISVLFVQTNEKGCDRMSTIICHANCVFQKGGNCNYKYSTHAGLPSCCENGCVYYVPRAHSVRGVQWHEAPPQCSAPQSLSDRQTSQVGQNAAWE